MQEHDAAAAQANRLDARNLEVIEQRAHVARALAEREFARGVAWCCGIERPPMAAQIGRDETITGRRIFEDVLPVGTASHAAVQPQQRLSVLRARLLPIELDA